MWSTPRMSLLFQIRFLFGFVGLEDQDLLVASIGDTKD
jgi:hypothetical protein